jgi:hypothetical protein
MMRSQYFVRNVLIDNCDRGIYCSIILYVNKLILQKEPLSMLLVYRYHYHDYIFAMNHAAVSEIVQLVATRA